MPVIFWGETVRHSIYILNRVPIPVLKQETPYKAGKGKRPNPGFLKFSHVLHI